MGAGRKTETFTLAPDSLNTYGNCCVRNLEKKDLCGAIFGFKFSTIKECYGLPAPHLAYIKNIDPGLIFEGQLNIDLKAWSPNGTEPSPYPAQVKMLLPGDPFVEENFSLVIADNDKDEKIFWFELDRDQTSKLLRRSFSPSPSVRTYKYAASPSRKAIPASSLVEIGDATRVDKWSSTHEVPSQASKGVENPWSSAASRALSSRQDTTKGTSPAALNMIGSSKDVSADDAQSEIDWDAASNFQAHLEGLNKSLEDPGDSFNSCVTMCVRNLHKGCLSGVISGSTFCTKKLSGLPAAHVAYIKNIDPKALSPNGTDPIPYPAQVKMLLPGDPFVEEKLSLVIADNYKDEKMLDLAHKELGMSVTDQPASVKASVPPQDPCSKKRKCLEVGSSEPNDSEMLKKSKLPMRELIPECEREYWSLLVRPGRYKIVDPVNGLVYITSVSFNDVIRPDNSLLQAPECDVYLGINSTREESIIGTINTFTRPQIHFNPEVILNEMSTLGHSAFSTLRFTGYRYGRLQPPQPQPPQPQPPQPQLPQPQPPQPQLPQPQPPQPQPPQPQLPQPQPPQSQPPQPQPSQPQPPQPQIPQPQPPQPQLPQPQPPQPQPPQPQPPQPQPPQPVEGEGGWPFDTDVTSMILSMCSSEQVARAEVVSRLFYEAGRNSIAYENINLSSHNTAEDLTALMCMRRAGGQIRSLVIGISDTLEPNYLYTTRVLQPLQYLGGLLTKLCLYRLPRASSTEDLSPVFAPCPLLKDFEFHSVYAPNEEGLEDFAPIPLQVVVNNIALHCSHMERLVYCGEAHGGHLSDISVDALIVEFVNNCPSIKELCLRGIHVGDRQLRIMLEGFRRLTRLDLSFSVGFNGSFLVQAVDDGITIEHLKLESSQHITEVQLALFLMRLRQGSYSHMISIFVRGEEIVGQLDWGYEERIGVAGLAVDRPEIRIEADFLLFPGLDEEIEAEEDEDEGEDIVFLNHDPDVVDPEVVHPGPVHLRRYIYWVEE